MPHAARRIPAAAPRPPCPPPPLAPTAAGGEGVQRGRRVRERQPAAALVPCGLAIAGDKFSVLQTKPAARIHLSPPRCVSFGVRRAFPAPPEPIRTARRPAVRMRRAACAARLRLAALRAEGSRAKAGGPEGSLGRHPPHLHLCSHLTPLFFLFYRSPSSSLARACCASPVQRRDCCGHGRHPAGFGPSRGRWRGKKA